jgi:hypothetical protein
METGNMPVLATYIARASYGVVVREPYSPDRHIGEQLEQDQFDPSQTWAVNQIEWIIRKVWVSNENLITLCVHLLTHLQGDKIDPIAPLTKQFIRRLSPGQTAASFNTQVVTSRNEIKFLPQSLLKGMLSKSCQPYTRTPLPNGKNGLVDGYK